MLVDVISGWVRRRILAGPPAVARQTDGDDRATGRAVAASELIALDGIGG